MLHGILVVGSYTVLVSTILYLTRNVEISEELLREIHDFNR